MARKTVKKASKKLTKEPKKLIYVFCEGESEIAYIHQLKNVFKKVAVLRPEKAMIPELKSMFKPSASHEGEESEIDEIWFFFDIEDVDRVTHWESWKKTLKDFSKGRKTSNIKIRLLMTTACVEYWFLLHYQKTTHPIKSSADKNHVSQELSKFIPSYKKADRGAISEIASNYATALKNGAWTLQQIPEYTQIPTDDWLERDSWLFTCNYTFTTVHEALSYLEELTKNAE